MVETDRSGGQKFASTTVVDHGDVMDIGELKAVIKLFPGITAIAASMDRVDFDADPNGIGLERIKPNTRDTRLANKRAAIN